jgi:hypothetical protein
MKGDQMKKLIDQLKEIQSMANIDSDGDTFFCKEANFPQLIKDAIDSIESTPMKVYELELKGFDGSTDETDDKIIWISIPANYKLIRLSKLINEITELPFKKDIGGIDLVIK